MNEKIYILLPVHNRKEITRGFVECLNAQKFDGYHLVLIDDGSSDGTAEMVRESIPVVTVLRGTGDWWWAGSLQRGLKWLKERRVDDDAIILFINDDVRFPPDYLEQAVRVMAEKKGVLMLSRSRMPGNGEIVETGVCADLRHLTFKLSDAPERINCLSTRGLFVHWGDIRSIGGFRPTLLPHYLSDYEYTIRAHRKGFKCESSAALLVEPNDETSGYHVILDKRFRDYLRKYFSKKSVVNPVYWSSFALLACGPVWAIPNVVRIWITAGKTILRALFASRNK